MFQRSALQKLYPHLNLTQNIPRDRSVSPRSNIPLPTQPVYSIPREPVIIQKPIEKIEIPKLPEPTPSPPPTPIVEKVEPVPEPLQQSKSPVKPVKAKRVRKPKVVDAPVPIKPPSPPPVIPKRSSQIPAKGEKGLQNKYTLEQKREMFLNKLSRKSVNRAEKEIQKINEVLNSVEHNETQLKSEELSAKNRLKVINTAKLFLMDNNINEPSISNGHAPEESSVQTRGPEEDLQEESSETSCESD